MAALRRYVSSSLLAAGVISTSGCASRAGWDYAGTEVLERQQGSVLTAADMARYPPNWSVEQIMVQAIPGLQLMSGNQGPYIVVRGLRGTTGTGGALIIVDGVPRPEFNPTIGISPLEVERVEVLKDAASTALYGFRGSAGVVLVRSKRGG